MNNLEKSSENVEQNKKGVDIKCCIEKANEYISKNGICLFLFDVVNSKDYVDRQNLQTRLENLITELNNDFAEFFPENNIANLVRQEKGFPFIFGDGSWAGINSSDAITKITQYMSEKYADISFNYDVAENGFDDDAKIVK